MQPWPDGTDEVSGSDDSWDTEASPVAADAADDADVVDGWGVDDIADEVDGGTDGAPTEVLDAADASAPTSREPTCSPHEQPEYRSIAPILYTATELAWLPLERGDSLLIASDGQSLAAFAGPTGVRLSLTVPRDLSVDRLLGTGYVDGLGSCLVVSETNDDSLTLLTAERAGAELTLVRRPGLLDEVVAGVRSVLVQDNALLVQSAGRVARFEWEGGRFERSCEFDSEGPVRPLRDGEWLVRTRTSNTAGDLRQSVVDSTCAEVGRASGRDLSRESVSAVLMDAAGTELVVTVDAGFNLHWYDGESEGSVNRARITLADYSRTIVDARALHVAGETRSRLLINGELVVDPFGGVANYRLEGGLPAVGSSDAAISVSQSDRGLVWRPSGWALEGEPVVLSGQAFSVGLGAYGRSRVLLREVRSGFASSPQISGVRVDPGRLREVVTTFDNSALAFQYQGVRWSSEWPGAALSAEPELITVGEDGTPIYASVAVGRDAPIAFGPYWVPTITGGVCSAVLRPNTVSAAETSNELPQGMEWTVFGEDTRSVQGTRPPAVESVVYLRDDESGADVMVTNSGSVLHVYRISTDTGDLRLEASASFQLDSIHSIATLGDPRDGLLLAVTPSTAHLLALRQLELEEIARYETAAGFGAQRFLDDGRNGVVLIGRDGSVTAWLPGASIGIELDVPPATAGVLADVDMDGQADLLLRHGWDSENEFLYFADCWD